MTGRHWHYPAPATRDDLGDIAITEHTVPYAPGTHAVCNVCGRRIVFVEGYELRRDYWTPVPRVSLVRATDLAIEEENRRFLSDPKGIAGAQAEGDLYRVRLESEGILPVSR